MSIIALLVILALLGLAAWVVNYKLPIAQPFKLIINVVLIVIAVWLCLDAFGIMDQIRGAKVPSL
jgi:hypothetical protein